MCIYIYIYIYIYIRNDHSWETFYASETENRDPVESSVMHEKLYPWFNLINKQY